MLASRLRGLSRFQESTVNLGLSTLALDRIFDTINCLQILAHNILKAADVELRQFTVFSAWFKQEIEIQSTDPVSTIEEELADGDVNLDFLQILEYIRGPMLRSRLIDYFGIHPQTDARLTADLGQDDVSVYLSFKRDLHSLNEAIPLAKKLPGLDVLIGRLDRQCKAVFQQIAETQKQKIRFGEPIALGSGQLICGDMRMVKEVNAALQLHDQGSSLA